MKRIIVLFLIGGMFVQPLSIKAQGGPAITASNLTPQIKAIVEDVKNECGLNPNQTTKFTNDYVTFLNENAKPNANTRQLLFIAGTKFRGYLNDGQFTKLTAMIQAGKLDPAKSGGTGNAGSPPAATVKTNAGSPPVAAVKTASTPAQNIIPAGVSVQSNTAAIFEQLSSYMKVTADQSAKTLPILHDYDAKANDIKTKNAGNNGKIQSELATLNSQTIAKLKPILNDEQLGKVIIANTMEENILSGKNLSADQKAFLQKLKTQYGLNDVQLMAVVLTMVEGKVRGDAINQMAKTNPQGAAQELGNLLGDLDAQLKSALTADQYAKVKADIEAMIRGHKL